MIKSVRQPKAIKGVLKEGERKTARLTVRLRPSIKAAGEKLLHDDGQSLNDFICECLEDYVRKNAGRLKDMDMENAQGGDR